MKTCRVSFPQARRNSSTAPSVRSHDAILLGRQDLTPFGIAARDRVGLLANVGSFF
jgi:hypothetical protein